MKWTKSGKSPVKAQVPNAPPATDLGHVLYKKQARSFSLSMSKKANDFYKQYQV